MLFRSNFDFSATEANTRTLVFEEQLYRQLLGSEYDTIANKIRSGKKDKVALPSEVYNFAQRMPEHASTISQNSSRLKAALKSYLDQYNIKVADSYDYWKRLKENFDLEINDKLYTFLDNAEIDSKFHIGELAKMFNTTPEVIRAAYEEGGDIFRPYQDWTIMEGDVIEKYDDSSAA